MPAQVNIEVRAQVDDAVRNLGALNKSYDVLKNANRDAAGALGVFGVSLTALNSPLTAIASGIKDSIDTTLNWANTIDKLSRATGESAAETSQMAVVFEDFGIKADSLDRVIKQFTKNGLQFNMQTIKDLAKQYQAIQDPVERDKFAFDNFGRSGLELTEILSKTPAELQAVGDAALYSGKIMDEQGVEAAQHFSLQLAQLNSQLDGLKIQLGEPLINGLSAAVDGFHALTGIIQADSIVRQEHMGIISHEEAAIRAAAAAHGDLWAASRDLTDAEKKLLNAELDVTDLAARHTEVTQTQTKSTYDLAMAWESGTATLGTLSDAALKNIDATNKATKAQSDQATQMALNAGLSGTITRAEQDYQSTIKGNQTEIDKLTAEIAKYEALQGTTITTVTKGSATQEDYNLAVTRAGIAHQRLAEYHGKSEATLMSLNLAVQTADDKVTALSGKLGSASTTTADFTTKINEDKDALDKLNGANADAAAAIAKTTGEFILQQIVTKATPEAQLAIAHSLGLIDDASYNLSLRVQDLTHQWDLNKNGMIDAGSEANGLAGALHNQQLGVEAAAGALPPLADHIATVGETARATAQDLRDMGAAEDNLHDKMITITTNYLNNTYGSGGPGYEPPPNVPARARGGPVSGGMPYLVGENGPELFVPNAGGTVVNNYNTSNIVNATYGNQAPGTVAQQLRLMSKLNR